MSCSGRDLERFICGASLPKVLADSEGGVCIKRPPRAAPASAAGQSKAWRVGVSTGVCLVMDDTTRRKDKAHYPEVECYYS